MSIKGNAFADIMDTFFRVGLQHDRQRAALRLAVGEFKLSASFKGFAFATTRHRSRRLVHLTEECYSVWRPDGETHRLVRMVARGFCGQWIISAERASWTADEDSRCEECLSAARRVVARDAERETAAAARQSEEDRTATAVQTFVDAGLVQHDAIVEVDF